MFNEFDVNGLDVTRGLYYYKATYLNYITIYIYVYIYRERESKYSICWDDAVPILPTVS